MGSKFRVFIMIKSVYIYIYIYIRKALANCVIELNIPKVFQLFHYERRERGGIRCVVTFYISFLSLSSATSEFGLNLLVD